MEGLQPDPKAKRHRQNYVNSISHFAEYQKSYFQEFSLLYYEKNDLQNQLKERDAILEEQRRTIEKLMAKRTGFDVAVQTECDVVSQCTQTYADTMEMSVQTDTIAMPMDGNVDEKQQPAAIPCAVATSPGLTNQQTNATDHQPVAVPSTAATAPVVSVSTEINMHRTGSICRAMKFISN